MIKLNEPGCSVIDDQYDVDTNDIYRPPFPFEDDTSVESEEDGRTEQRYQLPRATYHHPFRDTGPEVKDGLFGPRSSTPSLEGSDAEKDKEVANIQVVDWRTTALALGGKTKIHQTKADNSVGHRSAPMRMGKVPADVAEDGTASSHQSPTARGIDQAEREGKYVAGQWGDNFDKGQLEMQQNTDPWLGVVNNNESLDLPAKDYYVMQRLHGDQFRVMKEEPLVARGPVSDVIVTNKGVKTEQQARIDYWIAAAKQHREKIVNDINSEGDAPSSSSKQWIDARHQSHTEKLKRMDAWVSSIQSHWDSVEGGDYPLSFEDQFVAKGFSAAEDIVWEFEDLEYEDHDVKLVMNNEDKRFGFSVIGGYDEGIAPRVDDITSGSPADCGELQVGDEIVEVNGKSVEHCTHAEIIAHIHQCILSKAIRLRVKRLKDSEKVPAIDKVQNAYIIAVEENARKKLENFSVKHQVIPVDMTNVPIQHCQEEVTSFKAVPVSKEIPPHQQLTKSPVQLQEKETQEVGGVRKEGEVDPAETFTSCMLSMPVAEKNRKSNPWGGSGVNGSGTVEACEMNGMMDMEWENPRKGKQGKGKKDRNVEKGSNPDALVIEELVARHGKLTANGKTSSNNSLNHDLSSFDHDTDVEFHHSSQNSIEYKDTGPHREMAIDCPESFVGAIKTPPRYPPPQSSTTSPVPRVPPTTPSKTSDSFKDKVRIDNTLSDAAAAVAGSQPKPTPEQLDRLRKHQEELRKRREEEIRHQQEQEFLRTSLRGSKKLQALENHRMVQGSQVQPPAWFVNTAFYDGEEEGENVDDVDGLPTSPHKKVQAQQQVPKERYLKKNAGLDDLLTTLHHIRSRLNTGDNTTGQVSQEVAFLKSLFLNPLFQQAVTMHQKMVDVTSRSPLPRPCGTDASSLAADLHNFGPVKGKHPAMQELLSLLNRPHLQSLLLAHDSIAERESKPVVHGEESDLLDYPLVQYGEDSVKIIHLEKTNEHLGATVRNEGDSVIVARIVKGGAAEKSGLLHEGDEILEVNGIDMRGKNVNEVSEILANMAGTITFMIIPGHSSVEDSQQKSSEVMHLRALFNYDPEDDPYIPCRELGISFLKGDILHAIQLTDSNWWQAHREGEEDHLLAGLIPSRSFQEQRESVRQQLQAEGKENKKRSRVCACGRKERKKKKKKKALYNGGVGEETEEMLTYEEVTRYFPQPNRKRPIVLIGPPDVGRQELRQRLMESDFERFAAAVPHTSRQPAADEQNGKDYHFIMRSVFEADILSGKFVEYGEYQHNLYGTSVESVRQVINQGKICILNLQPESLKMLRETDLKPYVIFVSPPNIEKLRQLQVSFGKERLNDEQLKEIIEKGREIEELYSHLFDYILVNMDMDRTYEELMQEINRIETEPQWVPLQWLSNYT